MKPFFSIIIPTLNEEKFLAFTLSDLVRQKYQNFEVIIVDASSTDRTKEIAMEFEDKLILRWVESEKKNVAFQRNRGAENANGIYLFFLDADTRVQPLFLLKAEQYIEKHKGFLYIPALKPDNRSPETLVAFNFANMIIGLSQLIEKPISSGGSMIVEKHTFHFIGGFSERAFMSEDHQLVQTARFYGIKARFMDNIMVKFSLRRMKKEGQLKVLYKYLIATIHLFLNGKVDKKIIEYEMGGQLYKRKGKKWGIDSLFNYSLTQIKGFIRNILS